MACLTYNFLMLMVDYTPFILQDTHVGPPPYSSPLVDLTFHTSLPKTWITLKSSQASITTQYPQDSQSRVWNMPLLVQVTNELGNQLHQN